MIAAWRQVFIEAGAEVPDRNIERLLRRTHVPVPDHSLLRIDLLVPGLNVARGSARQGAALTHAGQAGRGTSNAGGSLLRAANSENDHTYHEVTDSGLGALYCLGAEGFGRFSEQAVKLLPELARGRSRGLHPRLRRSTALGLLRR